MSSRPANKRPADPTVEKSANKKPANKKEQEHKKKASKELTNVAELDACRAGAANTKKHGEMRSRPTYNKRRTLGDAWDEMVGERRVLSAVCEEVTSTDALRRRSCPVVREQPTQKTSV